ncbi:DUF1634 domain-containing protein [Chloroflexota bacterium]
MQIEKEKIKPPLASLVYGSVVYWVTIIGSVIALIGSVIAFISQANFVGTSYWFSSLWQGGSTQEIWEGTGGSPPVGHWYLSHLTAGDGLAALGISVGVFSVTLAMVVVAIVLFRKEEITFGILALTTAIIITIAMLSLIPLPL